MAYDHWKIYGKKERRICFNKNIDEDDKKLNILYYVDHTSKYKSNTGIQRVVRLLGKYLDKKHNIYLVKFDHIKSKLENITQMKGNVWKNIMEFHSKINH